MKKVLFPHSFRKIGFILFVPSALLGLWAMYNEGEKLFGQYVDEVASIAVIIALLFIAFARQKEEDEMIMMLRLEALQWSIYIHYILLILAILFLYDLDFFKVLVYNMFTLLLVFIARFSWTLYKLRN
jgi:hypothetical protein